MEIKQMPYKLRKTHKKKELKAMTTSTSTFSSREKENPKSKYHLSKEDTWTSVRWSIEKTIEHLQHRITKATQRRDYDTVRKLQPLLTRNLSARLKAVRVAQKNIDNKANKTNKTTGNGEVWLTTSNPKYKTIGYRHKTSRLKRVYISSNGKQPTMVACKDDHTLGNKVRSGVHKQSYEFQPYGDCWNANVQIRTFLDKPTSPVWILNAQLESFDHTTNHDTKHTLRTKKRLNSPLQNKQKDLVIDHLLTDCTLGIEEQPTTPTPTIEDLNLKGLEQHLKKQFKFDVNRSGSTVQACGITFIYADEFIVIGQSPRQLERVKQSINDFLTSKSFRINPNKTSVRHISTGFNFLNWHFRKYNGVLLCTISKSSISKHQKEIKYLTKKIHDPKKLICQLNFKIQHWMNYHHCCNNISNVCGSMNKYLYERLMKWGRKRHSNKTPKWIFNQYWKHLNGRWTFYINSSQGEFLTLLNYNQTQQKIRRRLNDKINRFDFKNKQLIKTQFNNPVHLP